MIEATKFKTLTQAEWAAFMLNQIAYIKEVSENGQSAFGIFAADGTPLAMIADRDSAFAAVRQHDLEPMSVH